MSQTQKAKEIKIYDCTLREGAQSPRIFLTLKDKLRITEILDDLGVTWTEGGWPAANPKDLAYFNEIALLRLTNIRIVGFTSIFTPANRVLAEKNVRIFNNTGILAAHIFGKAWEFHVTEVLGLSPEENIDYITESIQYYKKFIPEVSFGAEHFFDGYRSNPAYAEKLLRVVEEAGADWIDLADTNGGSFPDEISDAVRAAREITTLDLAVHCHNDTGCAVANTIAAIKAGAAIAEGTMNGYSERCQMTDLCTLIPDLQLKLGYRCIPDKNLSKITQYARLINEIVQGDPICTRPYVGEFAFTHKAGLHIDAHLKHPETYQHIDPSLVGNRAAILLSDQSGRRGLEKILEGMSIAARISEHQLLALLADVKEKEKEGWQFDLSRPALELLVLDHLGLVKQYIKFEHMEADYRSSSQSLGNLDIRLGLEITSQHGHTFPAEIHCIGTVSFLQAARQIITELGACFVKLSGMGILNYSVRVINASTQGRDRIRILLTCLHNGNSFSVMGFGDTFISAGIYALIEAATYVLNVHNRYEQEENHGKVQKSDTKA